MTGEVRNKSPERSLSFHIKIKLSHFYNKILICFLIKTLKYHIKPIFHNNTHLVFRKTDGPPILITFLALNKSLFNQMLKFQTSSFHKIMDRKQPLVKQFHGVFNKFSDVKIVLCHIPKLSRKKHKWTVQFSTVSVFDSFLGETNTQKLICSLLEIKPHVAFWVSVLC